jgi:hypothetical protein
MSWYLLLDCFCMFLCRCVSKLPFQLTIRLLEVAGNWKYSFNWIIITLVVAVVVVIVIVVACSMLNELLLPRYGANSVWGRRRPSGMESNWGIDWNSGDGQSTRDFPTGGCWNVTQGLRRIFGTRRWGYNMKMNLHEMNRMRELD